MTDDLEIGTLPRFSRDITVLVGRGPRRGDQGGFAGIGVLDRFSGYLDLRLGPGRVPMIDLSYLTLDSILPGKDSRSTAGRRSLSAEAGAPDRRSTGRPPSGAAAREDADGKAVEPTVREVLHRSRDRSPLGERQRHATDYGRGRTAGEGDSPPRDRTLPAEGAADPYRTLLGPGTSQEGPGPQGGRDVGDRDSAGSTRDPRGTPSSGDASHDRTARPGMAGRSVGDRDGHDAIGPHESSPTMRALDRSVGDGPDRSRDGRPRTPPGEPSALDRDVGVSTPGVGVPPPRMITDTGDRSTDTAVGPSSGLPTRQQPADGRGRADRSATSATGDRVQGSRSPRLVLDRSGRGTTPNGEDQGDREQPVRQPGGVQRPEDAVDRAGDRPDPLTDLISASPDPESPAIDRLYRALQEREAIERRRGGEL